MSPRREVPSISAAHHPPAASSSDWVVEHKTETRTPSLSRLLKHAGRSLTLDQKSQAPLPGAFPVERPPEKPSPAYAPTESQENIQKAIKASAEEEAKWEQEEEQQLQQALAASAQEVNQKGKGKAPERRASTDPEELEMALALSASEAQHRKPQSQFQDLEEDELNEATQFEQWNRLQSHRLSLFDHHDTSSLSIITERTERTEQPYSTCTSPQEIDDCDTSESPSYFGLWLSPDAKGVLDNRSDMAILPPLSEMMQERPAKPKLPPRPLPPIPQSAPHTPAASEDGRVPLSAAPDSSSSSLRESLPTTVTPGVSSDLDFDTATSRPSEETPRVADQIYTTASESASSPRVLGPSTSTLNSDVPISANDTGEASPAEPSEVVSPQQLNGPLPPGARRDLRAYSGYGEDLDDDLQHPPAVRFGFLAHDSKNLPDADPPHPLPDVIQLSNVPRLGTETAEFATFAMDAPTWYGMLRFLNWHGDTRIEAHPRDIASEKYGNGETELAAQFLPGPKGQGKLVRISIRLLPPNPHARRRHAEASSSRMLQAPGLNRQSTNVMSLPDHLILPVKLSEVAAMLSTLRHLAFIAAATSPGQSSKKVAGLTTVNTLRALGLKIAELSHENATESDKEDRLRLRDKLKMKFSRS